LAHPDIQAWNPFLYPSLNHLFNDEGRKETMDSLLRGTNSGTWTQGISNEWGRLAQGVNDQTNATDTIDFILKSSVPSDKKVTYGNFICDYCPLKSEKYRVRLTVGGDACLAVNKHCPFL
jgi:hypothetical protein